MVKIQNLLLQNHWAIWTKLGTEHPCVKGMQVCSNERPSPFPRGDNYEIVKTHWRHLKIFHSKTTGPVSMKLGTKYALAFVCGLSYHSRIFTQMETSPLPMKGCKFWPMLDPPLMAIEQWGFLSVPHLLRHGASFYNGHLRGPVTLTPIAERLAVKLSLPAFAT